MSNRTANLEFDPVRKESLNDWHGGIVAVERATAGLAFGGQDVERLHNTDILMIEGVAMPDKTADSDRIEIRPKGNRSRRRIIDAHEVLMFWVEGTGGL